LTDQPKRMIVDFFKADKKKAKAKNEKKLQTKLPAKKAKRSPASDIPIGVPKSDANAGSDIKKAAGVFDGADPDYERFNIKDYEINEAAIIASRRNLYIKFPMLTM